MQAIVWLPLPDNSTLKQNIGACIYMVWKELCSSQFAARSLTFCIVSLHHKVRHFKSALSNFFSLFKISSLSLPLPPKKLIGNMEREFIAERQKGLQAYLDVITSHHLLSNCELVKKFLDPNSYSVNYTGKWGTVKVHYSFTAVCVCVCVFSCAGGDLHWSMLQQREGGTTITTIVYNHTHSIAVLT